MNGVKCAVSAIKRGGIIAHATEGVWGLSCDPNSQSAIIRILEIKQRSKSKGLLLIGGIVDFFDRELSTIKPDKRMEIEGSWPGHHTWVLPNTKDYSDWITGGRETVACRVPNHEQARNLSILFGGPLVSTSANLSGSPELKNEKAVRRDFEAMVDFILPGVIGKATGPSKIHGLDDSILRGERG